MPVQRTVVPGRIAIGGILFPNAGGRICFCFIGKRNPAEPDEILPSAGRYPCGTKSSRWEDCKKQSHCPMRAVGCFLRMGWDSNPRKGLTFGGFQDRCIKPLCHPSGDLQARWRAGENTSVSVARVQAFFVACRGKGLFSALRAERISACAERISTAWREFRRRCLRDFMR